jgi:hypothetical protein
MKSQHARLFSAPRGRSAKMQHEVPTRKEYFEQKVLQLKAKMDSTENDDFLKFKSTHGFKPRKGQFFF